MSNQPAGLQMLMEDKCGGGGISREHIFKSLGGCHVMQHFFLHFQALAQCEERYRLGIIDRAAEDEKSRREARQQQRSLKGDDCFLEEVREQAQQAIRAQRQEAGLLPLPPPPDDWLDGIGQQGGRGGAQQGRRRSARKEGLPMSTLALPSPVRC